MVRTGTKRILAALRPRRCDVTLVRAARLQVRRGCLAFLGHPVGQTAAARWSPARLAADHTDSAAPAAAPAGCRAAARYSAELCM